MSVTGEAINVLEGEAERLLWFPVITLGYIFTLTGNQLDFFLAAGAIAGIRLIQSLMDSEEIKSEDSVLGIPLTLWNWGKRRLRGGILIIYLVVVLIYAAATIQSLNRLLTYFTHTDLVLVGLSIFICGSAAVVLMNLLAGFLKFAGDLGE